MTRARDVANIDGLLTTTGDTYYASAAGTPARLGVGSTGQVLKVSGGVPIWAAGGKVLQVVGTSSTTAYTQSSTGYLDTATLTITPTLTTSKVLMLGMITTSVLSSSTSFGVTRGFNLTSSVGGGLTESNTPATGTFEIPRSVLFLDSPASTSAQTYTIQIAKGSSGTGAVGTAGLDIVIVLLEIGA